MEVAKNIIEKIEEVNSKMKIFCDFKVELILEQAKQSTDRWNTGTEKGDLDGVPIVIKDQIDIIGWDQHNFPRSCAFNFIGSIKGRNS